MKLAVVGSINMDMTVTAQRIPGKGETLLGESVSYELNLCSNDNLYRGFARFDHACHTGRFD